MKIEHRDLGYCTNIHPGETWAEVAHNLETFVLPLKKSLSPEAPMGIGLRLSNVASKDLGFAPKLEVFRNWLADKGLYVYTINGFPYGGFHNQRVKDFVHRPDWTTDERVEYTVRLAWQLAYLLPDGGEGGISTSPASYKLWYKDNPYKAWETLLDASLHYCKVVAELIQIHQRFGKVVHLDIEPEPDGLIESSEEMVYFFKHYLLTYGKEFLMNETKLSEPQAVEALHRHIRVCWDTCHSAILFEDPAAVWAAYEKEGILVGKVQASSALKTPIPDTREAREALGHELVKYVEPTYLHQVVALTKKDTLHRFPDLDLALTHLAEGDAYQEWRTHFHVPVFQAEYGPLGSTQAELDAILALVKEKNITSAVEVETYTWSVLPVELASDVTSSIERELRYVAARLR